jgi:catalase
MFLNLRAIRVKFKREEIKERVMHHPGKAVIPIPA